MGCIPTDVSTISAEVSLTSVKTEARRMTPNDRSMSGPRADADSPAIARQRALHLSTSPDTVSKTFPRNPTTQDFGTLLVDYPHTVKGVLQEWNTQQDPRAFALVQHLQGLLSFLPLSYGRYLFLSSTALPKQIPMLCQG